MYNFESQFLKCKKSHTLVQRLTITGSEGGGVAEPSWKHLCDRLA